MKDSLFNLIHSLSTAEKRQYKVFSKYSKGDSKYSLLFDAMNKQDVYDESKLIKKFGYTANPNGFSVAKNHLYKNILDFLRSKPKHQSALNIAFRNIQDVESLYNHKLYKESLQLTKKTILFCQKSHDLDYVLPILAHWKLRLALNMTSQDQMAQLIKESLLLKDQSIELLSNIRSYVSLYEQAFFENMTNGLAKKGAPLDRMMTIKNSPFLGDIRLAKSNPARIAYHLAHTQIAKSDFNPTKQLFHSQAAYEITTTSDSKDVFYELITITEYLEALLINHQIAKHLEILTVLKHYEIPDGIVDGQKRKQQSILYIQTLNLIHNSGTNAEVNHIEQEVETYITQYTFVNHPHEIGFLLSLATYFYLDGELGKSLKWIKVLGPKLKKDHFLDQYIQYSFLYGVLHFDLGNVDEFVERIPEFKRYLVQRGKMSPTEAFVFKAFKSLLIVYNDKKAMREAIKSLRSELKIISSYTDDYSAIDLNQAIIWTESKLKDKTMMQIIQEQTKKHLSGVTQ